MCIRDRLCSRNEANWIKPFLASSSLNPRLRRSSCLLYTSPRRRPESHGASVPQSSLRAAHTLRHSRDRDPLCACRHESHAGHAQETDRAAHDPALCRAPDYSGCGRSKCAKGASMLRRSASAHGVTRHSLGHRFWRKVSSPSPGRYRPGLPFSGVVFARISSFIARLASR